MSRGGSVSLPGTPGSQRSKSNSLASPSSSSSLSSLCDIRRLQQTQALLTERLDFLDPEMKSAHSRIDVLETYNGANADNINRIGLDLDRLRTKRRSSRGQVREEKGEEELLCKFCGFGASFLEPQFLLGKRVRAAHTDSLIGLFGREAAVAAAIAAAPEQTRSEKS